MARNTLMHEHFEHLAIVLPLPDKVVAMPRYGTGTTYQARSLEVLLEQIAPEIERGLWILVEDRQVAAVRQLAPTARVYPVACILCVSACAHQPPAARGRLRWEIDGTVEAATIHMPRRDGTRWAYHVLIRLSDAPSCVVLDLIQPTAEGTRIEHQRAADRREAKRLARAWFAEMTNSNAT